MALTAIIGVGVGLAGVGTYTQVQAAERQSDFQQQEIAAQQRAEAQRKQAMELDAQRRIMEQIRMQQRARSMALSAANNQGAILGTGLQGGYGQIAGQTGNNILGISQNREIGENLFGINQDISAARIGLSQAGADMAFGQGLTSFGNSLFSAAGAFGRLATPAGSYQSPGSFSGSYYTPGWASYNPNRPGSLY